MEGLVEDALDLLCDDRNDLFEKKGSSIYNFESYLYINNNFKFHPGMLSVYDFPRTITNSITLDKCV